MISIVSDLHLQHTALDRIRRREDGALLETRVVRNVNAAALSLLFAEIVDNAKRAKAKLVELVFAGDIFEMHRTPLWLLAGEQRRPTLHPAAASPELERKALEILAAIEQDNLAFFQTLASIVDDGRSVHRAKDVALDGIVVIPHYIPGNHDRLLQLWPSTRLKVRELLRVPAVNGQLDAPFPHVLERDRSTGYGVRIRHGHEYDPTNFSEAFDPHALPTQLAYEKPTLGDFVTIDIAMRLAVAFRAHYARELRAPGLAGDPFRRMYAALTEFDDVRPQSMLLQYVTDHLGAKQETTMDLLRPVLRDAYETAAADAFFVSEAERLGFGEFFKGTLANLIENALVTISGSSTAELVKLWQKFQHRSNANGPARAAASEPGLTSGEISLVVAGHTHEPDHVSVPGEGLPGPLRKEAYFLDTGTWRTRIDAGENGTFGRLRSYTMVFCYHDDELSTSDQRRFESWTGHLRAEDYGPMLSVPIPHGEPLALQKVRFTGCRVQHVDEGETLNGAELVLNFGVDGVAAQLTRDGVHDGDQLVFDEPRELLVDPALDGEVWCYGVERDLGQSVFDPDDALPWAVTFLARVDNRVPDSPFLRGANELRAADNRGNVFTLFFEVV